MKTVQIDFMDRQIGDYTLYIQPDTRAVFESASDNILGRHLEFLYHPTQYSHTPVNVFITFSILLFVQLVSPMNKEGYTELSKKVVTGLYHIWNSELIAFIREI